MIQWIYSTQLIATVASLALHAVKDSRDCSDFPINSL